MSKLKAEYFFIVCIGLILIMFDSCSIQGSLGGFRSEYKQSKDSLKLLFWDDNQSCIHNNIAHDVLQVIDGSDLKKCLQDNDKSVVYLWNPNCPGSLCFPLNYIQEKCDSAGYELFVVAKYFDVEIPEKIYRTKNTIFAINTLHYKSQIMSIYLKRFLKDLIGENKSSNVLIFEKNNFQMSIDNIDSLALIKI